MRKPRLRFRQHYAVWRYSPARQQHGRFQTRNRRNRASTPNLKLDVRTKVICSCAGNLNATAQRGDARQSQAAPAVPVS